MTTFNAIFPDYPRDSQMIDLKTGRMNPQWYLFFQQLTQALQTNLKPVGFVIPPLATTNNADLGNRASAVGNIVFNSTTQEFKGIIEVTPGDPSVTVVKTFTLT